MNPQVAEPTALQNLMNSAIVTYGLKILWAIAVIILLLLISKIIAGIVRRNIIRHADPSNKQAEKIAKLMQDVTFYVLVIFSFFIGFEMVGFNVGLIVWGISFWVWLAFKEILGNMVAGIMILYTKEFKLGDIIEVQADQVYFGKIEEITIRYTIIRTLDLRQVVLPNMTLITVPIKTYSSETVVKMMIPFWTHYDSDVTLVLQLIKDTVNSCDFIKEKANTKVFLNDYLDSSIEFKAFISYDPNGWLLPEMVKGYIYEKINDVFATNKINIPYNMTTLTFETPEDKSFIEKKLHT